VISIFIFVRVILLGLLSFFDTMWTKDIFHVDTPTMAL